MSWSSIFSGIEKVGNIFAAAGNAGQASIIPPPPQPETYYVGQQSLYPQGSQGATALSGTTWIILGLAFAALLVLLIFRRK